MIAMQYKIIIPADFNMDIIKQRVKDNGVKTNGFDGLLYKFYLVCEREKGNAIQNEYSPFYLWKDEQGMNKFIFNGFYDNILGSFGWQNINIGIPLYQEIDEEIEESKYMIEIERNINKTDKMKKIEFSMEGIKCLGKAIIYNPDKWMYVEYYFYKEKPEIIKNSTIYEVLHISK